MIAQLLIDASATLDGYSESRSGGWLFDTENYVAPGECGSKDGGMVVSSFPTKIWNPYHCVEDAQELVIMLSLGVEWLYNEAAEIKGVRITRRQSITETISITKMFDLYTHYTTSFCAAVTEVAATVGRELRKKNEQA